MTAGDAAAMSAELFRGLAWLMMLLLATLFMGMAFLAITNPPNWMPPDFGFTKAGKAASAAPSAASADTITSRIAFGYLVLNTATFAMALTTVLMPLSTKAPPTNYLSGITHMMVLVYITFSFSFVVVISNDPCILGVVVGILAMFATVTYFGIRFLSKPAAN